MKNVLTMIAALVVVTTIPALVLFRAQATTIIEPAPKKVRQIDATAELRQFAQRSIALVHSPISPGRKTVFTLLLTNTARRTFTTQENRKLWISLIGVESGYDGHARSNKGAVGLGQLLPKYSQAFGASCGLAEVRPTDLLDDATNLALSACYFHQLIQDNGGDASLAMVAYVAGPYSKDLAVVKAGKTPSKDAREYVKRIHIRRERAALGH